jgi:hypothetical protein
MFVCKSLCCTCICLSTKAFVLHLGVSVYKSLWKIRELAKLPPGLHGGEFEKPTNVTRSE